MKVGMSATGPTLDSEVDPRFGRCPWLLVIDTENMSVEALENPAVGGPGGAGIQAAQAVAEEGVEAVITGNCGPNAYEALLAAGIHVYAGASGNVREAVEAFRKGEIPGLIGSSVDPYSGIAAGVGGAGRPGVGRGMGSRGMGPGRGRRGGGRRRGSYMWTL